jgi:hypothetical protein
MRLIKSKACCVPLTITIRSGLASTPRSLRRRVAMASRELPATLRRTVIEIAQRSIAGARAPSSLRHSAYGRSGNAARPGRKRAGGAAALAPRSSLAIPDY